MPNTVYIATVRFRNAGASTQRFEKEDDAAKAIDELERNLADDKEFMTIKNLFGINYARIRREEILAFGYEERLEHTEEELGELRSKASQLGINSGMPVSNCGGILRGY